MKAPFLALRSVVHLSLEDAAWALEPFVRVRETDSWYETAD